MDKVNESASVVMNQLNCPDIKIGKLSQILTGCVMGSEKNMKNERAKK